MQDKVCVFSCSMAFSDGVLVRIFLEIPIKISGVFFYTSKMVITKSNSI